MPHDGSDGLRFLEESSATGSLKFLVIDSNRKSTYLHCLELLQCWISVGSGSYAG